MPKPGRTILRGFDVLRRGEDALTGVLGGGGYPDAVMTAARERAAVLTSLCGPDERLGLVDDRDDATLVDLLAGIFAGVPLALLGTGAVTDSARELARRAQCAAILHGGETEEVEYIPDAAASPRFRRSESDSPEAVVLFTSGTTGRPKGVRLSRANVLSNLTAMLRITDPWTPADRLGQVLTFSHSFGLSMALMAVARGTPIVLLPDGAPGRALSEAIDEHGVTIFACVPYFLRLMARRGISLGGESARSIHLLFLAGGGIADDEIDQLLPDLGGPLYLMYGFTETTARAAVRRHGDGAPTGSVGLPLPGTHIDIVSPEGAVLPIGVEGLVRATGPSLMIGYLGEPPRTPGTPVTTSDLGRLDDAGNLFITGREVEMMNFRGNRVSVVRIEAQAMRVDGVVDARAVPESRAEDAQCLLRVVLAEGAEMSGVRRGLIATIEPRGIIASVQRVESLPKTRSGKALRYED